MTTVLLLVVGLAILYQLAILVLITVGWRNPRVRHEKDPASLGIGFEEIRFQTAGAKSLYGWWIPCGKAVAPVLILVHGWGRNVQRMLPYVRMLHPAGFDLLVFDARHHGSSDEDGYGAMPKFAEDIHAAVDYLERRLDRGRLGVGIVGLSVGGSAAILASSRDRRIAAVATVGAFADPRDPRATLGRFWWVLGPGLPLAFRFVEWRMGLRFKSFAPQNVIDGSHCRFLLIHGSADHVIPLGHARRLAAAAGSAARLWVIPGRNHSDPHLEPGMADTLASFFQDHLEGAPAAASGK